METFHCTLCDKDIPTVNQVIHSAQCRGLRPRPVSAANLSEPLPASSANLETIEIIDDEDDDNNEEYQEIGNNNEEDDCDMSVEIIEPSDAQISWACRACTLRNPPAAYQCTVCDTPREEEPGRRRECNIQSDEWSCAQCTYNNQLGTDQCEMCGQDVRPAAASRTDRLIPHSDEEEGEEESDEDYEEDEHEGGFNLFQPVLLGAGLGAGAALFDGRSVMRGAAEGAGMGFIGGLMMHAMLAELGPGNARNTLDERLIAQHLQSLAMPAQRGVSNQVLQQLPTREFRSAADRPLQCTICLEHFVDRDVVRTLPCLHQFHGRCVDQWLRRNSSCPVCKHDIR